MMKSEQIPHIVADLMTEDLITLHASDRVGRARDLLIGLGIHALPIVDGATVVGIVTSADLVDDWPEQLPVSDVMSASPYRISSEATLAEAAQEMLDRQIHHLLVEDGEATVGILSSFDLLRAFVPANS